MSSFGDKNGTKFGTALNFKFPTTTAAFPGFGTTNTSSFSGPTSQSSTSSIGNTTPTLTFGTGGSFKPGTNTSTTQQPIMSTGDDSIGIQKSTTTTSDNDLSKVAASNAESGSQVDESNKVESTGNPKPVSFGQTAQPESGNTNVSPFSNSKSPANPSSSSNADPTQIFGQNSATTTSSRDDQFGFETCDFKKLVGEYSRSTGTANAGLFGQTNPPSTQPNSSKNQGFCFDTAATSFAGTGFRSTNASLFGGQTSPASKSSLADASQTLTFGGGFASGTASSPFGSASGTASSPFGSQQPSTGAGGALFGAQNNAGGGRFMFPNRLAYVSNYNFGWNFPRWFGQVEIPATKNPGLFQAANANVFAPKFIPVIGTDTVEINGAISIVSVTYYCITCMKEYECKSIEELRYEDYSANKTIFTLNTSTQAEAMHFPCPMQETSIGDKKSTTNTTSEKSDGEDECDLNTASDYSDSINDHSNPSLSDPDKMVIDNGTWATNNIFNTKRPKFDKVTFYDAIDEVGLDLDAITFIHHNKEVETCPVDDINPSVGTNIRVQITLDQIWPQDNTTNQKIKDPKRLKQMDFEAKLKRCSEKMNAQFIKYKPLTGSWVFEVKHSCNYSLEDSDDESSLTVDDKNEKIVSERPFVNTSDRSFISFKYFVLALFFTCILYYITVISV